MDFSDFRGKENKREKKYQELMVNNKQMTTEAIQAIQMTTEAIQAII